ncbi:methyltransferase domain-containing protein [Aureivirga marina]|uniref:methyltransferase domain-containing protein n=1 Tax=Aureivirga marina TaxID=1182451 RepID=UPI0018C9BBC5|nr:methyltransferase domain-containing protein [Aureivirga marina]
MELNKEYWENRYEENEIGWDIGHVSTPIKEYVLQLKNKDIKILIPGAGNAHEAAFLHENGFTNVHILDIAKNPLDNFKEKHPTFPKKHIIQSDLFQYENSFDLIIEQTFFCALNPELRVNYIEKMHDLLSKNGKIIGLLFNTFEEHTSPPFGGNKEEYLSLFNTHFSAVKMEKCYNSIKPRLGKELFFIAEK